MEKPDSQPPPPIDRLEGDSLRNIVEYLDGYIEQRVSCGHVRNYCYPKNMAPAITVKSMMMETCFLTSIKDKFAK